MSKLKWLKITLHKDCFFTNIHFFLLTKILMQSKRIFLCFAITYFRYFEK